MMEWEIKGVWEDEWTPDCQRVEKGREGGGRPCAIMMEAEDKNVVPLSAPSSFPTP